MLDVVIRGGTVVDGSGRPSFRADVGLESGTITRIEPSLEDDAATVIEAGGKLVTPGFIDVHTHFDAQAFWDTTLSPSPLHGVTTVIGGNCGFSIAPLTGEGGDYLMRMLARVEGMDLKALRTAVPWDWTTFGEWLDRLDGTLAVNAGFMVGHSAIRRAVMGERSVLEHATGDDRTGMCRLLAESLEAGGRGFSSSWSRTHNDAAGRPVPSRHADADELVELARVCRSHDGTSLEMIPAVGKFDEDAAELMGRMSAAAARTLNWNLLIPGMSAQQRELVETNLGASDHARRMGGRVLALTLPSPVVTRLSFEHGFVLDALPGWRQPMALPAEEKLALLADPVHRKELDELAQTPSAMSKVARWERLTVGEVFSAENAPFAGRTIGEISEDLGRHPFDVLCEIVVADRLRTGLYPPAQVDSDEIWKLRVGVWRDERTVVGGTDAGAHLDLIATFNSTTIMLEKAVRERGLLSWEEAVHHVTAVPAELYGISRRGLLIPGHWADICVIDPARIAADNVEARHDLPGGGWRLYGGAQGIDHVFVNGHEIVRSGAFTDARPGRILRSGQDTTGTGLA